MRYLSRQSPELSLAFSLLSVSLVRSWLTSAWADRRGSGEPQRGKFSRGGGGGQDFSPPSPPPSLPLTHLPHSNLSITVLTLQWVWPLATGSGRGLALRWAWVLVRGSGRGLNSLLPFLPISTGLGGQILSRGSRTLLRLTPHGGAPPGGGGTTRAAEFGAPSVAMVPRRIRGLEIAEETAPRFLHVAPQSREETFSCQNNKSLFSLSASLSLFLSLSRR